jgi:hypothetical protein
LPPCHHRWEATTPCGLRPWTNPKWRLRRREKDVSPSPQNVAVGGGPCCCARDCLARPGRGAYSTLPGRAISRCPADSGVPRAGGVLHAAPWIALPQQRKRGSKVARACARRNKAVTIPRRRRGAGPRGRARRGRRERSASRGRAGRCRAQAVHLLNRLPRELGDDDGDGGRSSFAGRGIACARLSQQLRNSKWRVASEGELAGSARLVSGSHFARPRKPTTAATRKV